MPMVFGLSYSEIVSTVEEIVRTPIYTVAGLAGRRLIYLSNAEGTTDLYALDLETGSRTRLTSGERILGIATSPSSKILVYARDTTAGKEISTVVFADTETGERFEAQGFRPSRILGLAWDGSRVAISSAVEEGTGIWAGIPGKGVELVHRLGRVAFVSSIRGDLIAGGGWLSGSASSMELFLFDISSRSYREFTPKRGSTNKPPRIGDKGLLLFASNYQGPERLYTLDPGSLEARPLRTGGRDHIRRRVVEYQAYDWADGERVWFVAKREGRSYVYLDGVELRALPGYVSGAAFHRESGRILVSTSSLRRPWGIQSIGTGGEAPRSLVPPSRPRPLARIGRSYFTRIRSFDGLQIPTYVVESRVAPRPGPTVVYVHGGPWWEVADMWNSSIASLAASGYHVVAPNFRGSTGYGEEFRRLDIGDPGGGDLQDVVAAARWALDSGLASKVAIYGYSYGGFMSVWASVKEPDLWSAAVAGASVPDWEEMYELGDSFFKQFALLLFDNKRGLWRERSAINYAERLRAPLCLIQPQNDTRTPLRPVLRYAQRLLELGKKFEIHVIPDMGHYIESTKDAMDILVPGILFLKKHL